MCGSVLDETRTALPIIFGLKTINGGKEVTKKLPDEKGNTLVTINLSW